MMGLIPTMYDSPLPFVVSAGASPQGLGAAGEVWALKWLGSFGWNVQLKEAGSDLVLVNNLGELSTIEVKTARRTKGYEQWQFCLYKSRKTDYRVSDYLILLALLGSQRVVPFVVPTSELGNIQKITISHPLYYSGRYAKYRLVNVGLLVRDMNGAPVMSGDYVMIGQDLAAVDAVLRGRFVRLVGTSGEFLGVFGARQVKKVSV